MAERVNGRWPRSRSWSPREPARREVNLAGAVGAVDSGEAVSMVVRVCGGQPEAWVSMPSAGSLPRRTSLPAPSWRWMPARPWPPMMVVPAGMPLSLRRFLPVLGGVPGSGEMSSGACRS